MDKLAEEIFLKAFPKYGIGDKVLKKAIKAMQAYHEAKLKKELIKFMEFQVLCSTQILLLGDDKFLDKYFKQRNK